MEIQKPRGTRDYFDLDLLKRRALEDAFIKFYQNKNYKPLETPMFERRDLFVRTVGSETDIVSKELFDLEKKSDEIYSLRPEFTAGVVRSLVEMGIKSMPLPVKVFSFGPCFRYEKPQKGRLRQFNQLSVELIGKKSAEIDAEVICDGFNFLRLQKIDVTVNLNTLGSTESREKYSNILREKLDGNKNLCEDCKTRANKNPLRVWDCKNEQCQAGDLPKITEALTTDEKAYFENIKELLTQEGVKFVERPDLVRGLDYYTGVVFEYTTSDDDQRQNSVGGGGRYDNLVQELGGPNLPAIGYGLGFDRVIEKLN